MAAEFLVLGWTDGGENHLDLSVFEISSQGVTRRNRTVSRWNFTKNAAIYADPSLENIWIYSKNKLYCVRFNGENQEECDFDYTKHIEGYNIKFDYILVGSGSDSGFCKMIEGDNVHTIHFNKESYHYEGCKDLKEILHGINHDESFRIGGGIKSGYQNPKKEHIPIADIADSHYLVWNYKEFKSIESQMSKDGYIHLNVNDYFKESISSSLLNLPGSQFAKYEGKAWECSSDSSTFGKGWVRGIYPIPGGEAVPRYPRPIEQQMFETRIQMEIDAIKSFLREKFPDEIDESSNLLNIPTEYIDSKLDNSGRV